MAPMDSKPAKARPDSTLTLALFACCLLSSSLVSSSPDHCSAANNSCAMAEKTYIMIKPDGVQRGLVGEIISRFEKKGFTLKAMKLITVERSHAEKHYADLAGRPFFPGLVEYICSGPVVAMVWEGKNVVSVGRLMIGATNPATSAPGTIRGDLAVEVGRNVIHGSDSVENGQKEIALWFPEGINEWVPALTPWIKE